MMGKGTIIFSTVGRASYGFDIFAVTVHNLLNGAAANWTERRLTDGKSVNFNGQFTDDEDGTVVFISERNGASKIYLQLPKCETPKQLLGASGSLFHDRPTFRNGRVFFVSAHEPAEKLLNSWAAIYSTCMESQETTRLNPHGTVDYSPSISQSGKWIAVASYGSKEWEGDFQELSTDIVVFRSDDGSDRRVLAQGGGWPAWSGDSTIFYHMKADDGWWSIFRVEFLENEELLMEARRITPPGVHAFTPAASHDGKWIAVATRRPESKFRHIEIFDLDSESFIKVTEMLNPAIHHYNPFISPASGFLGYHRFRGRHSTGDSKIPYLEPMVSPIPNLKLHRLNGSFPTFSPDRTLIAFNTSLTPDSGISVVKSNATKKFSILKGRITFAPAWNPVEKGVIFVSAGPIFETVETTVQIARISFDPTHLDSKDEISTHVKILTKEGTGNNAFPSCSPDGKFLVFRSGRSGYKNLYIIDAIDGEDGSIRRLTEGPWIDTMPHWSPDGKYIAFSSNRESPKSTQGFSVYLTNPDGTDLHHVHVTAASAFNEMAKERINHVCFSPDSKFLLFTANLGAVNAEAISLPNQFQPYGDLYICGLDGSGLRRLTCNAYEDGTPAWNSGWWGPEPGSSLEDVVGEELKGEFEEPLWLGSTFKIF
ncbi:uncharacterized protein LOC18430062 isoform X2 [Amborella trichopoda]|uniref:Dipeptidylpeptidase IV N-terminal domain-containing protein n=2 Tax=Amborella trichopoda TaxID=13333 RepID=W1P221_AMBTC|nr:uncharacterized protein LOC18430062 isoform X2 [Amborella trichopoda]ERN01963.1 hypothetical protein AMTR_s00045p00058890 [Amborella trichopoda]|eukprot:XP_006840288.1 uncharacterized protein LOC18430062 isoform X2 [Amborella trichopoda]